MEAREVPLFTHVLAMDLDRRFPLQKPDRVRHAVFRRNTQTPVNVVCQRMPLDQFNFMLLAQIAKDLPDPAA